MGVVKDLRCFYADGDYSSKPANNRLYAKERVEGLVPGAGEEETIREREKERERERERERNKHLQIRQSITLTW